MKIRNRMKNVISSSTGLWAALAALVFLPSTVFAQNGGFFNQRSVGGVSISTGGVLAQPVVKDIELLKKSYLKNPTAVPKGLEKTVGMRMISLRAVEEAVAKAMMNEGAKLPDEIQYLAGIQRIQFIFVYPEKNDIVLAGPGEGWKMDANANMVGVTTGRPVLRLEDLVLALRTVENARQGGITVSIDPTEEGRRQLDELLSTQTTFSSGVLDKIEKALGPQQISITGVPDTSSFARTLVGSDYKMKRIAMKLEDSPVKGLPSYIDMLKGPPENMMPRWWMACDYEPLAKSPDGLAWELRGRGVKVLTEDEVIANGKVAGTGKANPVAQKWADTMTAKFDELSIQEPVFGDLRNLMDMCVISAVIAKEGLLSKANLSLPLLMDNASKLTVTEWDAPKTVDTQCSATKRGREFIITASGGVEINSWAVADKTVENAAVAAIREQAAPQAGSGLTW